MLRETTDRIHLAGTLVRPVKPHATDPAYHHRHHAVHLALLWLHELTDAPLADLHAEFAWLHRCGDHATPARLRAIAVELMDHLYAHDDVLAPHEYAALYHQISQGLSSEERSG